MTRKTIATLLAVYLISLFVMPCKDACQSGMHEDPQSLQAARDLHGHEQEPCSPFCICSCCSTFVSLVAATELKADVQQESKVSPPLTYFLFSTFTDDRWQPPRMA